MLSMVQRVYCGADDREGKWKRTQNDLSPWTMQHWWPNFELQQLVDMKGEPNQNLVDRLAQPFYVILGPKRRRFWPEPTKQHQTTHRQCLQWWGHVAKWSELGFMMVLCSTVTPKLIKKSSTFQAIRHGLTRPLSSAHNSLPGGDGYNEARKQVLSPWDIPSGYDVYSSPWYRWPMNIDGLPMKNAWWFSMANC